MSVIAAMLMVIAPIATITFSGCRTAPISGRRQLVIIPESQEIALGIQAYEKLLADEPLSQNEQIVEMVNRVGRRIAAVADKPEYDWEFRVIAKDVMNAFALPGGKVAVYEGILPVCQDEAGLAVVMSHEIAHALARHGGERMSQQSVVSGLGGIINVVSQRKADVVTTDKIMQVYGAASKYGVILPYSRKHESEADAIGLILMAKAGYDPSVAPEFWERFSGQSGDKPPEWLSTHPADTRRAADLRALLSEAMNYYHAAPVQLGMGKVLPLPIRNQQSLVDRSSGSPMTPLQQLSFASGSPQKATTGRPQPSPKQTVAKSTIPAIAVAVTSTPDSDAYRLPIPAGRLSSQSFKTFKLPGRSTPASDDGWGPSTSQSPGR